MTAAKKPEAKADDQAVDLTICGIIMPISSTLSHDANHWSSVQKLFHRAISIAGFQPVNVWQNSSNDRVSERIIGNLFEFPMMIADISDLNPNVMLELGMRLASKKPTVVVVQRGGEIPFDIRDFHAVMYPSDMNMLEMENFFEELSSALNDKYDASQQQGYVPFLGGIVVDVLSPQQREVGINELLLDRLGDLSKKVSALESGASTPRKSFRKNTDATSHISTYDGYNGEIYFTIPSRNVDIFKTSVKKFNPKTVGPFYVDEDLTYGVIRLTGIRNSKDFDALKSELASATAHTGFKIGVPNEAYEFYSWS